jgi:hypothetical protein
MYGVYANTTYHNQQQQQQQQASPTAESPKSRRNVCFFNYYLYYWCCECFYNSIIYMLASIDLEFGNRSSIQSIRRWFVFFSFIFLIINIMFTF